MDREFVSRAQRGDRRAFEMIAADALPRLYRVAVSVLGDRTVAEDATQRALLAIWRYLPRLRDPQRFDDSRSDSLADSQSGDTGRKSAGSGGRFAARQGGESGAIHARNEHGSFLEEVGWLTGLEPVTFGATRVRSGPIPRSEAAGI